LVQKRRNNVVTTKKKRINFFKAYFLKYGKEVKDKKLIK